MVKTYKKMPETVQAVQCNRMNFLEVIKFIDNPMTIYYCPESFYIDVTCKDKTHRVQENDYVIKDEKGNITSCAEKEFKKNYFEEFPKEEKITVLKRGGK